VKTSGAELARRLGQQTRRIARQTAKHVVQRGVVAGGTVHQGQVDPRRQAPRVQLAGMPDLLERFVQATEQAIRLASVGECDRAFGVVHHLDAEGAGGESPFGVAGEQIEAGEAVPGPARLAMHRDGGLQIGAGGIVVAQPEMQLAAVDERH
jgi:hypothetical protein